MSEYQNNIYVKEILNEVRQELAPYLNRLDLEQLSKHNMGYLTYSKDPTKCFIDNELHAHLRIINYIKETFSPSSQVLEIGFFIPVIPIALAKLGFQVSSVEKLEFYGHALDEIISYSTKKYNIKLFDLDILNDDCSFISNHFDIVILSAIIEHLNGTPKYLLDRVINLGKKDANYLIGVPNVATLRKRLRFLLRGIPPFPSIDNYYHSSYPFTGHNREYTKSDLQYILHQSELDIIKLEGYNRSIRINSTVNEFLWGLTTKIGSQCLRESFLAIARKR